MTDLCYPSNFSVLLLHNYLVICVQVFAIVVGCMLFIILSLTCEIVGARRRHDHDNLQVRLRLN